jgi:tetraacyldisaccharide 4'-kinase
VKIIESALTPLSWLYGLVVVVRNWLYDHGCRRSVNIGVPVISVGNITVGGTGKTPLVALIASRLSAEGKLIAIVSRGYRRKSNGPVIVSDGNMILADALLGGDEPIELAQKVPQAIIGVDARRVRISRMIIDRWKPDVIIMDDGFQHRMLQRSCDCVVVDAHAMPYETRMLPSGWRREPLRSLRRADLVVVSRWNEGIDIGKIRTNLQRYTDAPIVVCRYVPAAMHDITNNSTLELDWIRGRKCAAFCGVGSPEAFDRTLGELGIAIGPVLHFSDHHCYTDGDAEKIAEIARLHGAEMIITTEKDAVRLARPFVKRFEVTTPLVAIKMSVQFAVGEDLFWSTIGKKIQ